MKRQRQNADYLYGLELRQTDTNGMFGEKDVFLTVFNHLCLTLGAEGRKQLERYLPTIPRDTCCPCPASPFRNCF